MMRSTWKRALSTILTVCMIASLLVVPASAALGDITGTNTATHWASFAKKGGSATAVSTGGQADFFTVVKGGAAALKSGSDNVGDVTVDGVTISCGQFVDGGDCGGGFKMNSGAQVKFTNTKAGTLTLVVAHRSASGDTKTKIDGTAYTASSYIITQKITEVKEHVVERNSTEDVLFYISWTDDDVTAPPAFSVDEAKLTGNVDTDKSVAFTLSNYDATAEYTLYSDAECTTAVEGCTGVAVEAGTLTFTLASGMFTEGTYYVASAVGGKKSTGTVVYVRAADYVLKHSLTLTLTDVTATVAVGEGSAADYTAAVEIDEGANVTVTLTAVNRYDLPATIEAGEGWTYTPADDKKTATLTGAMPTADKTVAVTATGPDSVNAVPTADEIGAGKTYGAAETWNASDIESDTTLYTGGKVAPAAESKVTAAALKNIELWIAPETNADGYTYKGAADASYTSAASGITYTGSLQGKTNPTRTNNVPSDGSYYKFIPAVDGVLEITGKGSGAENKPIVITSDEGGSGFALLDQYTLASSYNSDLSTVVNVTAGKTYYYYVDASSKVVLYGITFWPKGGTVAEPTVADKAASDLAASLVGEGETAPALNAISFDDTLDAALSDTDGDLANDSNYLKGIVQTALETKLGESRTVNVNVTSAKFTPKDAGAATLLATPVEVGSIAYTAELINKNDNTDKAAIGGTVTLLAEDAGATYIVTPVASPEAGGTIGVEGGSSPHAGETVTVTAAANEGYTLTSVTYQAEDAETPTTIEKNGDGKYTFAMPAANVTVTANFTKNKVSLTGKDVVVKLRGNDVVTQPVVDDLLVATVEDYDTDQMDFTWTVGDTAVEGTAATYTVKAEDMGKVIKVKAAAKSDSTDYEGTTNEATLSAVKGKAMTVTADDVTADYDGAAKTITAYAWDDKESNISEAKITYKLSTGTDYADDQPEMINAGTYTVDMKATAEGYEDATGSATVTINKVAAPVLTITASDTKVTPDADGGEVAVTLTVTVNGGTDIPDGLTVTCTEGGLAAEKLVKTENANTWTASLPDATATYTFTAAYAGDANHEPAESKTAKVSVTEFGVKHSETEFSAMNATIYNDYVTALSAPAQTELWGDTAPTFAEDASHHENVHVTGTLKYVDGFTGFSDDAKLCEGWYLPLQFTVPDEALTAGTVTIVSDARPEPGLTINLSSDNVTTVEGVKYFSNLNRVLGKTAAYKVTVDWDGDGATYTPTTFTLDFNGVTFEGKDASDKFVFANLTDAAVSTEKGVAAKKVGLNTYEVTISTGTLTAHKRTGMETPDTEDAFWVGVGLPEIDFNSNSLFVSKDEGKTWTWGGANNVGGHSMTYTNLVPVEGEQGATLTLKYKVTKDNAEGQDENGEIQAQYTVTFKADELVYPDYNITKGAETNGTFTVSATKAKAGTTVEVTPTAADGYTVKSVKFNDTAATEADGKYTFVMPADDVTVTVEFEAIPTHNVTWTANGWELTDVTNNGTSVATPASPIAVMEGKDLTFKVNVTEDGKKVGAVTAGGETLTAAEGVYTITMGNTDVALAVTLVDASTKTDISDKTVAVTGATGASNAPKVGDNLTASIDGVDAANLDFTWTIGETTATGATYEVKAADEGKVIKVKAAAKTDNADYEGTTADTTVGTVEAASTPDDKPLTAIGVDPASVTITGTGTAEVTVSTTPADTTDTVKILTAPAAAVATATLADGKLTITGVAAGTTTVVLSGTTAESVTKTVDITVEAGTVTPGGEVDATMGWHITQADVKTLEGTGFVKIDTNVKGVDFYLMGGVEYQLSTSNTKDGKYIGSLQGQTNPTKNANATNLPTAGTVLRFDATQAGTLTVDYVAQKNALWIVDKPAEGTGTALDGFAGSQTAAVGEATQVIETQAGHSYYFWVNGSKIHIQGFTFATKLAEADVPTVDLAGAKTAIQGATYTTTLADTADQAAAKALAKKLAMAAVTTNANNIYVDIVEDAWTEPAAGGNGTYKFKAKLTHAGDTTGVTTDEITMTIVAGKLVETITVTAAGSATEVMEGKTLQLSAEVLPADANNTAVEWSSSDETKATVSETGLVTGVAPGAVKITATAADGSGVKGEIDLTVTDDPTTEKYIFLNTDFEVPTEDHTALTAANFTAAYPNGSFKLSDGVTNEVEKRTNGAVEIKGNKAVGIDFVVPANTTADVTMELASNGGGNTSNVVVKNAAGETVANTQNATTVTNSSPSTILNWADLPAGTYTLCTTGESTSALRVYKIEVVATSSTPVTEKVTVTYEAKDAEGNAVTGVTLPAGGEVDKNTSVPLTAPTAPTGYTFDGWYVGETKITEATYTVTADTTFTAKFTKSTVTPGANKTALTDAIAAANAAAEAITVDTDAANVAEGTKWVTAEEKKAYTDAIAVAQAVADKADATQTEVDDAVTALATATTTFEAAKKDGTKKPVVDLKDIVAVARNGKAVYDGKAHGLESVTVTEPATGATVTYATSADGEFGAAEITRTDAGITDVYVKITAEGYNEKVLHATITVSKAPVELTLTANPDNVHSADAAARLVTLTPAGMPEGGKVTITCDVAGVTVAEDSTVTLPDETKEYTFTATYAGDDNHEAATATCVVNVTKSTEVNKVALNRAIAAAEAMLAETVEAAKADDVDEGTKWALKADRDAYQDAIDAAKAIAEKTDATAEDVAKAETDLAGATTTFEGKRQDGTKPVEVKTDDLAKAVTDAKAKLEAATVAENGDDVLTSKTWISTADKHDLEDAIAAAEALLAEGATPTQADVDSALEALKAAVAEIKNGNKSTGGGYRPSGSSSTAGTGTKTETLPDGTKRVTETKKDGTVVTTQTKPDGTKIVTTTDKDGNVTGTVTVPGSVDKTTVSVPVADANTGMVPVIVKADGTEEIIRNSSVEDGEVIFPMTESGTIKIVNNAKHFVDLDGHWAEDEANYVSARELFNGVDATHFAPDATMTRGMMATVLFRLDGESKADKAVDFSDVKTGDWFAEAVDWAAEAGVINGYTDGTFGPNKSITREELVVMVYRYAGTPEADAADMTDFTDADQVADWAETAMNWAVKNGIINGKGNGILDPKGNATRAEVSAVLERFVKLANQ